MMLRIMAGWLPRVVCRGNSALSTFRAFILNDQNKIIRSEVLNATSDEEAFTEARQFAANNDLEIWQGERRIARMLKGGEIRLLPSRSKL